MTATKPVRPRRYESPAGLVMHMNANGSLRRMEHGDIVLNLFPGTEMEGGPANVYLRRHGADVASTPLLGPCSPLTPRLDAAGLRATGEWLGLRVTLALRLAAGAPAWFWHVALENPTDAEVTVDLVYAQDLALAHYDAIRMNEYYVSQYIDHTPLTHPERGCLLAVRQNLSMGGHQPWAMIGSLHCGVSFATDALQLHGLATRAGEAPAGLMASRLPGVRQQHEHSMAVIQDAQLALAPGATGERGFFGWFEPDHQAVTSDADLAVVDRALALPEAAVPRRRRRATAVARSAATLFSAHRLLRCRDLTDAEITRFWGNDLRHVEREDSRLLSFFVGARTHVALRAKEVRVLRPHGHLLRTGDHLTPDEASLTTTVWMAGVFNALLTQGHVSINRLLSTTRSYLSLQRAHGQRVFVEQDDGYALLDVPSAWEVSPSGCRWLYAYSGGLIEVRVTAPTTRHAIELHIAVLEGLPLRFLLSNHVALNGDDGAEAVPVRFKRDAEGIIVRPIPDTDVGRRFPDGVFRLDPQAGTTIETVSGDAVLFADGRSRQQPFLTVATAPATRLDFRITGGLVAAPATVSAGADDEATATRFWTAMTGPVTLSAPAGSPFADTVAGVQDILPWYTHNALIHYLAPRGLEQYSGGGWGTRDVCQGPVELLLALGRWEPLRDLLLRVFANQNPDGDWPQWFMFFERERNIRPADSHGDIVFWPVLVLAQYLIATEEAALLDVSVPFFHPEGDDHAERATIWGHVERALRVIERRVIPGTHLAAYGHGDWNDSLRPVDPAMGERLCSAWTVTLHYQTLTTVTQALRRIGRVAAAEPLAAAAERVKDDFQRLLIPHGTITGYAHFQDDGRIEYLLHPHDETTGITASLLPMIHAIINDLLTPQQAAAHVDCIRKHLLAVDGARLFDRPFAYHGGLQRRFQRAESSTFFGREIGIMYTHAHLRCAEAMARYGDADAVLLALRQANPIGLRSVLAAARPRQANCYYSSSDAAFLDRYQALAEYETVKTGAVPFEGGWRVYSSGAGIAVRLIHECLLGIRRRKSGLVLDPVIPLAFDGLRAEVELCGKPVSVVYRTDARGHGPTAITLNGAPLPFVRAANPYRTGGVEVSMIAVRERLTGTANTLVIELQ